MTWVLWLSHVSVWSHGKTKHFNNRYHSQPTKTTKSKIHLCSQRGCSLTQIRRGNLRDGDPQHRTTAQFLETSHKRRWVCQEYFRFITMSWQDNLVSTSSMSQHSAFLKVQPVTKAAKLNYSFLNLILNNCPFPIVTWKMKCLV